MKIYILRHEDSTMDSTFFSPLTKKGLKNALSLMSLLRDKNIKTIYSSPFIRALQTVYPYSDKYKIPINLEYSLIEFQHNDIIPKSSYSVRLPEYIANDFNSKKNYKSEFEPEDICFPEKIGDVKKRVKKFISNLIRNYHNRDINILIITHQLPCNIISMLSHKHSADSSDKKYLIDTNYPTGGLSKIFDDKSWVFDPINWEH